VRWQNRAHFVAVAAQTMRRILVDVARKRQVQKRGGGASHVTLHEGLIVGGEPGSDLVALDDGSMDREAGPAEERVVELVVLGGLNLGTAEALGVSTDTVEGLERRQAWLLGTDAGPWTSSGATRSTMTPERWQQVERALRRPRTDRPNERRSR
jgi:hypothetical protein